MTARSRTEDDLRAALADPGFTPGRRDFRALLDLVAAGGDEAERAEQGLRRAGAAALPAALAAARAAEAPARAALTRLVGRLAGSAMPAIATETRVAAAQDAEAFLVARLGDEDSRTRRMAAIALGKLSTFAEPSRDVGLGSSVSAALTAAARTERAPEVRRAIAEALGKVGGRAAIEALEALAGDADVARERGRAALMARRTLGRGEVSAIASDVAPERPIRVAARCRRGLEGVLLEELSAIATLEDLALQRDEVGGARVELMLKGPLSALMEARTMLSFAFPLEMRALGPGEELADAVVAQLVSAEALATLRRFTRGGIRYRIAWAGGGKRRAAVWRVAQAVEERAADIVNDPTRSTWDVVVYEARSPKAGRVRVELAPRAEDRRFEYRQGAVPAASHPTIAAALARIAGARAEDVVWDPFAGSGLELCERARLGPFRRLVGSDRDGEAIRVARENLNAVGAAEAELSTRDALAAPPLDERPTLIVTNPPMGRRVHRAGDLGGLLERFVERAGGALAAGGRLVWISPFPERTEAAARRSGLVPGLLQNVDMGGFDAQIQVFLKLGRCDPWRRGARPAHRSGRQGA